MKDSSNIPGFRTGAKWKMLLAVIGYGCMIIYIPLSILEVSKGGFIPVLLETAALLLYIIVPFAMLSNLGRWDRRLPGLKKLPLEIRIMLRIVISFLLFYGGMLLENYVRFGLVGITKAN